MNEVKYLSTRGLETDLNFEQVLLSGLARDGGLYLPNKWPKFTTNELYAMRNLDYISLADKIITPFVDNKTKSQINSICKNSECSSGFSRAYYQRWCNCWSKNT